MTAPLSDDFASARRPLLAVVPDPPEPEPSVWVEVDGETVCAFGFILLALVALTKFLVGFDGDWTRLGWYLLAAVAAPPLIMIAIGAGRAAGGQCSQGCPMPGGAFKGSSTSTAVHEAGHHAVGEWLGNRCRSWVEPGWSGGGFCALLRGWFRDPIDNAAFLYAGYMAMGSKSGASCDLATADAFLGRYPADQRAARKREAERKARAGLSATGGYRSRIARILHERGTFG